MEVIYEEVSDSPLYFHRHRYVDYRPRSLAGEILDAEWEVL